MIGKLKGLVDTVGDDWCLIDVNGVGYVAYCPSSTLAALGEAGSSVVLHIETHVREDMIRLYGFSTAAEKAWFNALLANVQGVGARLALSLLSTLGTSGLSNAVAAKDLVALCKAPGVGKKVAERIASEMSGKVPACAGEGTETLSGIAADAVQALAGLGYGRSAAAEAVSSAMRERAYGPEQAGDLLRAALKKAAA